MLFEVRELEECNLGVFFYAGWEIVEISMCFEPQPNFVAPIGMRPIGGKTRPKIHQFL